MIETYLDDDTVKKNKLLEEFRELDFLKLFKIDIRIYQHYTLDLDSLRGNEHEEIVVSFYSFNNILMINKKNLRYKDVYDYVVDAYNDLEKYLNSFKKDVDVKEVIEFTDVIKNYLLSEKLKSSLPTNNIKENRSKL